MGISRSMERHHQLPKIWEWEITHKNHLSAACIPGKLNTVPEKKSRSSRVDTERMPHSKFLNLELENVYFKPEIDLFATNINAKFSKYAAFLPDPRAMYIDALNTDWYHLKF